MLRKQAVHSTSARPVFYVQSSRGNTGHARAAVQAHGKRWRKMGGITIAKFLSTLKGV